MTAAYSESGRFASGVETPDKKIGQDENIQYQIVARYFLETFEAAYYVNLKSGEWNVISRRDYLNEEYGTNLKYNQVSKRYIDNGVLPADREKIDFITDLDRIRYCVRENPEKTVIFTDTSKGYERYCKLYVLRGEDMDHAAIGFQDVDEETRAAHNREETLRRDLDIIEILASEYSSVYYINLDTDELNPYTMNAETESEFGQIFNSGITYSEAFRLYVDKLIYPEDKELMLASGSIDNIRLRLKNQKTFITQYRSSDNRYNEMKFVKVGDENDAPVAVALGFSDRDDAIRAEKEAEIQNHRYSAVIKALSSEYSSVYYVDLDENSFMPYNNSSRIIGKFGSNAFEGLSYAEAVEMYTTHACSEKDRERLAKSMSPDYLRLHLADKQYFTLVYQNDKDQYCEMKCVRADDSDTIHRAVVGFAVKDEEIRSKLTEEQERRRNYEIIEVLASEYTSVYYINLVTDALNPYTMNEETETTFGSVFRSGITYSEAFRLYVDKLVYSEDKYMMLRAGSVGNIMKELRTKKTFITTYRNADGHYSEMKFVKVGNEDGAPVAVALGFADKDQELRTREEAERALKRNIDIIEILASEYTSVYYVDLTTDGLDTYTMNEQTETTFGSVFRSGIRYSEAFRLYVDKFVHPEDKKMMLKAGSIYNILVELCSKKTFLTYYRNTDGNYCEMKFVKVGEDENPEAVALGFSDKDQEVMNEINRKKAK